MDGWKLPAVTPPIKEVTGILLNFVLKFKNNVVSLQDSAQLRWIHTGKISKWFFTVGP
jgi:hypothetical protein